MSAGSNGNGHRPVVYEPVPLALYTLGLCETSFDYRQAACDVLAAVGAAEPRWALWLARAELLGRIDRDPTDLTVCCGLGVLAVAGNLQWGTEQADRWAQSRSATSSP